MIHDDWYQLDIIHLEITSKRAQIELSNLFNSFIAFKRVWLWVISKLNRGLNHQPTAPQAYALPCELSKLKIAPIFKFKDLQSLKN